MADANKTEPGSQHKREEAKKKGQLARAKDLPGALGILAAIGVLAVFSTQGVEQWRTLLEQLLDTATAPNAVIGMRQLQITCLLAVGWSALIGAVAWVSCAAIAFQGGFVVAPEALFKLERLQPAQNVKNLFTAAALSKTAKSVIPVLVMGYLTWGLLSANWGRLAHAADLPVAAALGWMGDLLLSLAWRGGAVLLGWAAVDYVLQRRTHETSLRMTKQEVKQENKELVGSPETRGRIRKLQRQMARRRMMREVATASVVVTNPTHFAVALRYEAATMAAPVVVAKGRDLVAARIRALAVSAGVPIVENREVARALHKHVEVGMPIPGRLYAAVAEILAFIHRARSRQQPMAAMPALPAPSREI